MFLELAMALAMQDATTRCTTFGGAVTCNTTQNTAPSDAYNAARESALRRAPAPRPRSGAECAGGDWWLFSCSLGEHREAVRQRDAQQRGTAARERAMTLLRSGDCPGAVSAALDTGDLQFATDVRAFCQAAPPPQ